MKRFACILIAALMLGVFGCDKEISRNRSVEVDGNTVTEKETIVREKDGAIEVEKKKIETEYDDNETKTESTTEIERYPKE